MGPNFGFSSTPRRKVKNDILRDSHKISRNEALSSWSIYFGSVMLLFKSMYLRLINADDKPLLFGALNEHAVSITCPQEKLEPQTKRFVL